MKCKNKKTGGAVDRRNRRAKYNELKIILNTNIPTDKYGITKQVTLTGNTLGAKYNNGPYFSTDVLYSDYKEYFNNLPREKILDVFFNEREFVNFIQTCLIRSEKMENYENMQKYVLEPAVDDVPGFAEANIMFMLNKIINISFPIPSFVTETYVDTFNKESYGFGGLSTILNIDEKSYTVTKATWQNDFYSNPDYNHIYTNFLDFDSWFNNNKNTLIDRSKKLFNEIYLLKGIRDNTVYDENIVEYVVNEFCINFSTIDDTKKKLSNIIVNLLNDDKKDMDKRRYGHTEKYDDYDAAGAATARYKKTSLEYEANLSKSISRTRETSKETELKDFFKFIEKVNSMISSYSEWKKFFDIKKEKLADIKYNKYNSKLKDLLENLTEINKYIETIKKQKFYTGVEQQKDGKYKIILYVDVIGGKIDKNNASMVNCAYKSKTLGSEFEMLWDGNEPTERIFVDINKNIAEANKSVADSKQNSNTVKKGGRRQKTRKNIHRKILRTRRKR